jgi:transposase InsO family protein
MAARSVENGNGISQRRACRLVGLARSTARYELKPRPDDAETIEQIRELATKHKRYGYRRITSLLRRDGSVINVKRVHRLWKTEGLQVGQKRRRRRRMGPKGEVTKRAEHPNHVWTYDFVEDRTERGGRLRILTVLDEYTRTALAVRVANSFPSASVIEELEWLFLTRGVPKHIRSDNGPEFTADAIQAWLSNKECDTIYIKPGSPWENPFIESFNGSLRDECLNMELFDSLREAREVVENWRRDYNDLRPHSSLGYKTPSEFARDWRDENESEDFARAASPLRPTASANLQRQADRAEILSL